MKNFTYAFSKRCPFPTLFSYRLRNSHNAECHKLMKSEILGYKYRGGGTPGHWPRKGDGDVRPWRPPFHATPVVRKGPISSKRVNSQDPLMRKFGNLSLCSLNFCQNFSSQAPNLEIFLLTSPQIWKFSVHKPPLSEASISSQATHFGNPGRTPLPKKSWVPPPPRGTSHM